MIIALLLGAAFGFVSAIPVAGPISALIFSKGMKGRYSQGRFVAAGAALVESGYTFLAFWSFNHFLTGLAYMLILSNAVAAVLLGFLGVYFFRSKKMRNPVGSQKHDSDQARGPKSFLIGAGICLVNPSLIATWTAFITTLYSMSLFEFNNPNAILFSTGVFSGIFIWFTVQLKLIAKYRSKLNPALMDKILKIIGFFLLGLAALMIFKLIKQL